MLIVKILNVTKNFFIKLLIKKNFNINITDNNDNTLLLLACKNNDQELIKKLVKRGTDINKENDYGVSPLKYTTCKRNRKTKKKNI